MARRYYYDNGEEKVGPVSGEDLLRLCSEGEIDGDTWVRRDSSRTWRPLRSVDLREEEEEMRNPSLLRWLWRLVRKLGFWRLLSALLMLLVFALVLASMAYFLWPVLLVVLLLWLMMRLGR